MPERRNGGMNGAGNGGMNGAGNGGRNGRLRELDERLAATREQLLGEIRAPHLEVLTSRARTLAWRRRASATGAVVAGLLLVAGLAGLATYSTIVNMRRSPAPVGATPTAPSEGLWGGSGLSLYPLTNEVLDLPGEVYQVELADRTRGYALAAHCPQESARCTLAFASTQDGGHSWTRSTPPVTTIEAQARPRLTAVGSNVVLLTTGGTAWSLRAGQPAWTPVPTVRGTAAAVPSGGRLGLIPTADNTCSHSSLWVWRADATPALLATQPPMQVCRVAPAPAADGTWWVGGQVDGVPAVGASRDHGRRWTVTTLASATRPAPEGSWAQVSTIGSDVLAAVVSRGSAGPYPQALTIQAIYRSTGGKSFTWYAGGGAPVVGEVVALLDGRLVAAGPGWQVTTGPDRIFAAAGGTLPRVERLQRTAGGWVAYNLFDAGWCAVSRDGVSWQKISLR